MTVERVAQRQNIILKMRRRVEQKIKGVYILLIRLDKVSKLNVGKIGTITFKKGYYTYVGSALNGLQQRVKRHLASNKKVYWHIDYLLKKASIKSIFYKKCSAREECKFANYLANHFELTRNFGATDCKCKSHLFYSKNYSQLQNVISQLSMNRYKIHNERKCYQPYTAIELEKHTSLYDTIA